MKVQEITIKCYIYSHDETKDKTVKCTAYVEPSHNANAAKNTTKHKRACDI